MPGEGRFSGGAAYRNRIDDLRITRRITVVQGCPGSHVCPARLASQSVRVRDDPGSLLANPLARSIRTAAPTAAHPDRTAPGRPPGGRTPGACAADDAARERLHSPTRFPSLWAIAHARSTGFLTSDAICQRDSADDCERT